MTRRGTPPRLCIVNLNLPPAYGGAEMAAYRYAERYRKAGGQVLFVGPDEGLSDADDLPSWVVPAPGLDRRDEERAGRMPGSATLRKLSQAWPRVMGLRDEYDLLHIFNARALFNLGAIPMARICGKPVVLEMSLRGSDDPLALRQGRGRRFVGLEIPPVRYLLFRLANRFVAKSRALSEAFLQSGLAEERLVRIPYGIDVHRYHPVSDEERRRIRVQLGLSPSALLILFVGSLNPRKGVHWLLEAFSRLADESSAELVLVGPADKHPQYAADLRRTVNENGLESRVTFVTANAGNVSEYMQAADVFTLPSVREGLPISVLEAMASGMAIVASDIPEIAGSQIEHEVEGLLFPTGDVSGLTRSLGRLVRDPEERRRLGRRARERALREFDQDVVDAQYRRLYAELLRGT